MPTLASCAYVQVVLFDRAPPLPALLETAAAAAPPCAVCLRAPAGPASSTADQTASKPPCEYCAARVRPSKGSTAAAASHARPPALPPRCRLALGDLRNAEDLAQALEVGPAMKERKKDLKKERNEMNEMK